MTKAQRSTTTPSERKGSVWVAYTDPPGPATATSVRPAGVPGSHWSSNPWPDGDEKAAGVFVPPEPEWREPLEHWLPEYHWSDEPDRAALERILMGAPFNLSHERFNRRLTIRRVMEYLKRKGHGARPAEDDNPHAPPCDGPAAPNLLIWKGERHELPPRLWRLLDFMWERDEVPLQELEARVWDCEVIRGSTVNATVSKLNTELLAIGCPVTLSVKSGHITKT